MLRAPLRAAAWRYPLLSGGASLVQREPFRRLTPAEAVCLANLRDGGRLFVRSQDFIGRAILLTGDYDPKLTWLCRQVLRRGDTMLDVGANQGVVTAYAARLVGPTGFVHAFEPQPELAALLSRSMTLNGYHHVQVHPYALSNSDGHRSLHGPPGSSGMATLEPDGGGSVLAESVEVRRAGDVFQAIALSPIRLLKVDIEGHEESFLQGCLDYLRRSPPEVVAFESHGVAPFHARPAVAMLRRIGYAFYQVPKALVAMRLNPVAGKDTGRGFDYVAVLPESEAARRLTGSARRRVSRHRG